jgi:hypothetical protein
LFLPQVRLAGGYLGDRDSHGGVVSPFAGLPPEAATAEHCDVKLWAAWRAEFVCGTEGITGCGSQQNTAGPVKLSSRKMS